MTGSPSLCPLGGGGPHIIMDGGEVHPARLMLESHHYLWLETPQHHHRTPHPPRQDNNTNTTSSPTDLLLSNQTHTITHTLVMWGCSAIFKPRPYFLMYLGS